MPQCQSNASEGVFEYLKNHSLPLSKLELYSFSHDKDALPPNHSVQTKKHNYSADNHEFRAKKKKEEEPWSEQMSTTRVKVSRSDSGTFAFFFFFFPRTFA